MHRARQLLRWISPFAIILAGLLLAPALPALADDQAIVGDRAAGIMGSVQPKLRQELDGCGLRLGAPVFIRIFKLSRELEVWLETGNRFQLFKTYSICDYSGYPGPKLREGDWQSPEGFYTVSPEQMNPRSEHHLSFDLGYPNEYDRLQQRTGSALMVHGGCTSMGCYAMTDHRIEEIYALANAALNNGQPSFSVHIFPFRMTDENMQKFKSSPWIGFWRNLKRGYDIFERSKQVPSISVSQGEYQIKMPVELALSHGSVPSPNR